MEIFGNFEMLVDKNRKKTRLINLVFITIPAAGVEPARPCGHWILSSMNPFFKSYNLDLIGF